MSVLYFVTIYTKKTLFKLNIYITQDMTFQSLLDYVFPKGPLFEKQFVIKLSKDLD
ncbi:44774_t:CDS:1, partial [Gigaspora margarita]